MEKETPTKHQSIYYVTAASTLWTRSPFIQRIRYRVRLYCRNNAIPSGKKSAGGGVPKPRHRPRCSDRASLTGDASRGRASRAGCGTAQTHSVRLPTNLDPRRAPFVRGGARREERPLRAQRREPATARMADSQPFCVAEERSGHCAVVDGNFLYVWGGYVVRGRGGTGRTRAGSPPGLSARADAERPPTAGPRRGPVRGPGPAPPAPARPSAVGRCPSRARA